MEMNSRLSDLVRYLKKNLGVKMTAYISGLCDSQPVNSWLRGKRPRLHIEMRLRYAHQAVMLVREAYGQETAQSWLWGKNSHLNDCAPAMVLRRARTVAELEAVVQAAKAFVSVEASF